MDQDTNALLSAVAVNTIINAQLQDHSDFLAKLLEQQTARLERMRAMNASLDKLLAALH